MKLSIGSGPHRKAGWHTLDADPRASADYQCAVPPLPPAVMAQGWDEIEAIHFLEHLAPWEAAELLMQLYSSLRPGGRLVIELPNLLFAAKVLTGQIAPIAGLQPGQCDMWPIYGDPTSRNLLMGHKWGYTPATLRAALEAAGFARARIVELPAQFHVPGRDFRMEAVKG